MSDESNKLSGPKAQKLAIRERLELYSELKKQEVEEALRKGYVRDPVTTTLFGLTFFHFIAGVGLSVGLSIGASLIAKSLAPKAKPQRIGSLSGEVQGLMRSEQGVLINEIYGGDPGDGKGGIKIPATIIWASKLRKTITVSRQETGGGKFGGGQTQNVEQVSYDLDIALMGGRGPLALKREWGNTDKIIDLDKRGYYEAEDSSNTFTPPYQITSDQTASDGSEVTLQNAATPTSGVQFNAIESNGATTRDLTIYYATTGSVAGQVIVNGTPISVTFPNSSNARTSKIVSVSLNDGTNTIKIRNLSTTLNLRIDKIFCFPGTDDSTGIIDPAATPDAPYDPDVPGFDPQIPYDGSTARHSHVPAVDAYEVTTGQTNQGGYSDYAIYPGNDIQLEDPTIQSDIDGKYGSGSTPAYRSRAYVRHAGFQLTRWQGVVPSFSQLWEHLTIKNLNQMVSQWCDRVGALTSDYDFSGLTSVKVRGWLVSGRRYQPKEVITETEDIYDVFYTENEGQIIGLLRSNAPTVTIPETDIGWAEDDENETVPSLTTTLANELDLPRRVDVKFIDPDRDFETNTQGESRQITEGESSQLLEVAVTLTAKEADEIATRKLYRDYVEGDGHSFTLSWTYLYLYPGYVINTTKNGFTLSMQLTEMKGGISLLECQAVTVETSLSDQNASTSGGDGFERPPVPIPAMTILALLDIPVRDKDADVNGGLGIYIAGTPRTNTGQKWSGFAAYIFDVGWEKMCVGTLPATMGVISDLSIVGSNTSTIDTASWIEFDLYHTDDFAPVLESVSETDLYNGANLLSASTPSGDILVQFKDATQVSPNKWRVTNLLHGRGGTEHLVGDYEVGRRVVLLNEAVQFVPLSANRLNRSYDWTGVSNGQSLDDAAVIEDYAWSGQSRKPLSVVNVRGSRDSENDLLIEFEGRTRTGGGIRDDQGGAVNEEEEVYKVQILDGSGNPVDRSPLIVTVGMPQAAALNTYASGNPDKFDHIDQHSVSVTGTGVAVHGRALQTIWQTGNYIEATLMATGPAAATLALLDNTLTTRYSISVVPATLSIGVNDGVSNIIVGDYDTGDEVRLRISLSGTEVRFYLNYDGGSTPPLFTSPVPPSYPLIPGCTAASGSGGTASVFKMFLTTRPYPKTIYGHGQQSQDGYSPGDPIEMDIWQWSPVSGDGTKVRTVL
jgi:hypothetical protein